MTDLEPEIIVLSDAAYARLLHDLENPPEPGERLRALFQQTPPWGERKPEDLQGEQAAYPGKARRKAG